MIILVKKWRKPYGVLNLVFGKWIPIYDQEEYLSFTWMFRMWERELAIRKEHHEEMMRIFEIVKAWEKLAVGPSLSLPSPEKEMN